MQVELGIDPRADDQDQLPAGIAQGRLGQGGNADKQRHQDQGRDALVGDDLVEQIVGDRLAAHDWNFGFIIDGFPRNARQAEFFLESYDIDGVINLDLPDDEVRRRVLSRRVCSQCGLDYNLIAHRPEVDDICDVCHGSLKTRDDDNPEALAARLTDYHQQTKPLLEIFQRKEFVVTIDATGTVDEVQATIREKFPQFSG